MSKLPQAQRSPLKWAGSKHKLIPLLRELLPPGKRLIEPFAGSAVVSLNLDYPKYLLGEMNPDVVTFYTFLQNEGDAFMRYCKKYFKPENNCKEAYIHLRERFNLSKDPREKSALFLYLNRHGFNGLCRYNSSGKYNVPFGQMKYPEFPEQRIHLFRARLNKTKLVCQDFTKTMRQAKPGDVVYCDPPYVPLSETAKFKEYHTGRFSNDDQVALAELGRDLSKRGIPVIISNHDTEYTREIYKHAKVTSFPVARTISCNWQSRVPVSELLAIFTS